MVELVWVARAPAQPQVGHGALYPGAPPHHTSVVDITLMMCDYSDAGTLLSLGPEAKVDTGVQHMGGA